MKVTTLKIIAVLLVCIAVTAFSSCGDNGKEAGISVEAAESLLTEYLSDKGFGEKDFLSESHIMDIDGENVYAFSWRTQEGENADRLSGMYAVSFDGKSFYEYQSARDEWIKDMNASDE
ncbi:MAG: hypothetical protein K2J11_05735 [Oscillospiraceae bacterium]|nr:hypothetical protein [Oscillospiraceae bacterium]